ncbi:GPI-anchored surface protein, putative [Bodo saltans]|uniref:GPI-anchored surface protein, putative n=1 Tax=Bodo saltans TaxID=75058 RepID=A0A0S4IVY2_BODSA|nr:GPI-anchored surface protein, putative [Bodo saltans]|eukprot:CUG02828.1 GPI-anchored surface protein, putative [Bodo saltans]
MPKKLQHSSSANVAAPSLHYSRRSLLHSQSSSNTNAAATVERQTVDRALSTLCDAVAPPTTTKGAKQHHLPPILTAAHPHARVAALASLLREVLRSTPSSSSSSSSASSLELAGCGVELSDFPMMGSVLSLCPHVHTIDLRSRLDEEDDTNYHSIAQSMSTSAMARDHDAALAFLEGVLTLVTNNQRLCRVIVDGNDSATRTTRGATPEERKDGGDQKRNFEGQRQQQVSGVASSSRRHRQHVTVEELHDRITEICQRNQQLCDEDNERVARVVAQQHELRQQQQVRNAVAQLQLDDADIRKQFSEEEHAEWISLQEKKQRAVKALASTLRKKLHVVAHQRQIQHVLDEEFQQRSALDNAESVEMRLIVEADCGFCARFLIAEELRYRREYKKDETAAWVLTRRAEKARYAQELAAREALFEDERLARQNLGTDLDRDVRSLQQLHDASAADATAAEQARIDRIRREEAVRKRLEDQARERAEKEEDKRQKALREFLHKQHQAREKMETDAGVVRKSLRTLEAAAFSCVSRIAATWMPYLLARHEAEKATTMYCKLLTESPSSSLQLPHSYVAAPNASTALGAAAEMLHRPHLFVTEGTKEWLHVTSASNFLASTLNPHRRAAADHQVSYSDQPPLGPSRNSQVPRFSLWGGGSQNPISVTTTPPPEEATEHASSPQSPTIGTAGSFQGSHASPPQTTVVQPPMFTVALRDGWMAQTKAAQQEFRSKLNKFENVKASCKVKVQDELKAYSAVIQQHRLEYARWRWMLRSVAASASPGPLASPNAKSPVFSPTTSSGPQQTTTSAAAATAIVDTAFVTPEPLADPLAINLPSPSTFSGDQLLVPAIATTSNEQLMVEVDTYMKKMATCTPQHEFLTVRIINTLCEEDIRTLAASMLATCNNNNSIVGIGSEGSGILNAEASVNFAASTTTPGGGTQVAKEPPVALLRYLKESIDECTIFCAIEGDSSRADTDFLRFELPRKSNQNNNNNNSTLEHPLQQQNSSTSSGIVVPQVGDDTNCIPTLTTTNTDDSDQPGLPVILKPVDEPISHPSLAVTWLPDREPPTKLFDNRFLSFGPSGGRSGFRFGSPRSTIVASTFDAAHSDTSGPTAYEHAPAIDVAVASALQHRLDLDAAAEAIREAAMMNSTPAASTNATAQVDYAAISQAKELHEFLASETFRAAVRKATTPHAALSPNSDDALADLQSAIVSNNGDYQLVDLSTVKAIERDLMSKCEYEKCSHFSAKLLPKASTTTPRPGAVTASPPTDAGLLSIEPTMAISLDDANNTHHAHGASTSSAPHHNHHHTTTSGDVAGRNEQIIADITKMFSSVEFYASVGAIDGVRGITFRVQWSAVFDASTTSIAFHVLRCLQRRSANEPLTIEARVAKEESLSAVVPVLVMAPRYPRNPIHLCKPVLVTKADVCVVIPPTQSAASGFNLTQQHQPPKVFHNINIDDLKNNIVSVRTLCLETSLLPAANSPVTAMSNTTRKTIPFRIQDENHYMSLDRPFDAGYEVVVSIGQAVMSATKNVSSPIGTPEPQLCFSSDTRMWFTIVDHFGQKKDPRSPFGTVFLSPSGDGLHGIPILEVTSGTLTSCGTVPLSHSSSSVSAAVNVARKLSRRASNAVALHSSRRHSVPNSARGDRISVVLRVEPEVATPSLVAEFIGRLSAAAATSSLPSRSQPTTPRSKDVESSHVSSTYRVDVFMRPPPAVHSAATPHNSARDNASGSSVPSTPREEHSSECMNSLVLSNRLFRSEVPVISGYLELHALSPPPPPLAVQQPPPSASPRGVALHHHLSPPCGAFWLRSAEPVNIFLNDSHQLSETHSRLASVEPFRHCRLRLQMPDDCVGFDPAVVFTIVVSTPTGDLDVGTVTPAETSRVETSRMAILNVDQPLSECISAPHVDPFFLRMPTRLTASDLFECQGQGEPMSFILIKTEALRTILPMPATVDDDDATSATPTIQVATMKSEDPLQSMTVTVSFKQLLDWVHRRMNVPVIFSRYLVPVLLDLVLSSIAIDVEQASAEIAAVSMALAVDVEIRTHVEEDVKPTKGKKAKPVAPVSPEALAQMQHVLLPRCTVQAINLQTPIQHPSGDFIPTRITCSSLEPLTGTFVATSQQRDGSIIIGGILNNSGILRLRSSSEHSSLGKFGHVRVYPPLSGMATLELAIVLDKYVL